MTALSVVPPVARLEIQRAELVQAQAGPFRRRPVVQTPDSSVLGPELRVVGLLPRLGVTPPDPLTPQDLPQPLQTDRIDDPLLDEVFPQLGQRPDAHPDQLPGRRERNLGDPLGDLGHEPPWIAGIAEVRVPRDGVQATVVEPPDDPADPGRGVSNPLGDLAVALTAARQENDSCMTVVDRVGQLPLQAVQHPAFPRSQLPCDDLVHIGAPFQLVFMRSPFNINNAARASWIDATQTR